MGDTIAQVTSATGIDKAVKFLVGEDCGCEERKAKLNSLFRYKKPNCLNESEYKYLNAFFSERRNTVSVSTQQNIYKIFNRVFDVNREPTSCADCFKTDLRDLQKIIESYKIE